MKRLVLRFCGFGVAALAGSAWGNFSSAERLAVKTFWADPSRMSVEPVADPVKGQLWVVRQSVEGSTWLWNLNRARNLPKGTSAAANPWDQWIDARMAMDQWQMESQAALANAKLFNLPAPIGLPSPPDPGLVPDDLVALVGNPPRFFALAIPQRYCVRFDDTTMCTAQDQVAIRARSPYYRFAQGVRSVGVPLKTLPGPDLSAAMTMAGITESQARVMRAVSLLEGGFDALNTYDTGAISVGFIQFTAGVAGNGALVSVLMRMKAEQPEAFEADFRAFGVDVSDSAVLQVVDPTTGAVLEGALAVQKVIEDKRLSAVFQRAGMVSRAFRVCQLEIARDRYLPANDPISVMVDGQMIIGTVSDCIRSEAGLATLMDRKVNVGNIDSLATVIQALADQVKPKSLADLLPYEREVIERMKYRKDYLVDSTLTQPAAVAKRLLSAPSRGGKRITRGAKDSSHLLR